MIAVLSTSSPRTSVAVFHEGSTVFSDCSDLPHASSQLCLEMLQTALSERGGFPALTGIVADRGPGSFTGTKVGVTLAKVLTTELQIMCGGILSFDLISTAEPVAIRIRKGVFILREPSSEQFMQVESSDALGYGPEFAEQNYPDAARADLDRVEWIDPLVLVPEYGIEPSISTPKVAYRSNP